MIVGFVARAAWPPRWRAAGSVPWTGCCSRTAAPAGRPRSRRGRRARRSARMRSWPRRPTSSCSRSSRPGWMRSPPRIGERAKALVSLLGATSLERVRAAFPGADVFRVMPNVAVEVRRGVLCVAGGEIDRGQGPARRAGKDGRAARLRVRRRDGDHGLCTGLPRARGRGPGRRRGRRRPRRGRWHGSWWSRPPPGRPSCCGPAIRPTSAGPSPRREAAPRPASKRSTARAPATPSPPRSGLAREDERG